MVSSQNYTVHYLPEVLRYVVLQFALHQVAKQRLDLVENALFWLIGVIFNGQESLKTYIIIKSLTQSGLKEQMPPGDNRR